MDPRKSKHWSSNKIRSDAKRAEFSISILLDTLGQDVHSSLTPVERVGLKGYQKFHVKKLANMFDEMKETAKLIDKVLNEPDDLPF